MIQIPECRDSALAGTGSIYQLEKKFKSLTGHSYSLAVCNATQALFAIFLALELKRVEFVTTPYTWPGSLAGAFLLENVPVFADIDPLTLTLDPLSVKQRLSTETKAILAVDIYGNPCHADALKQIAQEAGVWLIMDCAQSFGAMYNGKQSGALADVAVFSLSPGKALFAGEGAVITTSHAEIYEKLVYWTQHPYRQRRDIPHEEANEFFLNMRIHPLAAEWAKNKFDAVLESIQSRQKTLTTFDKILAQHLSIRNLINTNYLPSGSTYYNGSISKKHIQPIMNMMNDLSFRIEFCKPPLTQFIYEYSFFAKSSLNCNVSWQTNDNRSHIKNVLGITISEN
ncbi:MAG: DegT/DnrJ/EryC1/StrS family aminotransferase [candidate division KSB1 bacterium]|nr:DegT/DnrJ/EryC1/StrS family aminotransferase [candidate division KSB1 bacterium]MDQ7063516.1 DegT/DnrJ/EryC1/StrS family aminotransferase [candidate division KSB1 bacterium]